MDAAQKMHLWPLDLLNGHLPRMPLLCQGLDEIEVYRDDWLATTSL